MMGSMENNPVKLTDHCYIFRGAVNTGILIRNHKALLFDCCDTLMEEGLEKLGVEEVDRILFTQHRRTHTAGAYRFVEKGTQFIVPCEEKHLFHSVEAYWEDEKNRWHLYHNQPGPLVMTKSLPVSAAVREGDVIEWEGFRIDVVDTPGVTDGSVSYVIKDSGKTICFSGDVIYGYGQVSDIYSLQKGFTTLDYHGFMGNMKKLVPSMKKLQALETDMLVPSHGELIRNPSPSIHKTIERLDALLDNYRSISSMNYYFPDYFGEDGNDFEKMNTAKCTEFPDYIKAIGFTSFVILSDTGAALLIDCGHTETIEALKNLVDEGIVKSVDGCWITHYHDDHVDFLNQLVSSYSCPVMAIDLVAGIIGQPKSYFLPCISPCTVPSVEALPDGFFWNWNEFTLTAFHFPGQTLYHGGLFVEGHHRKIFFSGDSFSPTGIDDYCSGNRNFLGENKGFLQCINVLRRCKPDYITNQHQRLMFEFGDRHLDYMESKLKERIRILTEILPWDNPNFGTDEWWVRTYPYEQEAMPGSRIFIEVHLTNHGSGPANAIVQPVLPEGWESDNGCVAKKIIVPPETSGTVQSGYVKPDGRVAFDISVSENTAGKRYIIPFRVHWNHLYLGQFRHAVVIVKGSNVGGYNRQGGNVHG